MSRIVQALEQEGHVHRERDPQDGRIARLRATPNGRRVLQHGRRRRVENLAALLGRLDADEIERVREAAELVERALGEGGASRS
jgi:DNA-binding MarR family transcriptional regulator